MKKILALTLALALTLVLASCTKDKEENVDVNIENEVVDEIVDEVVDETVEDEEPAEPEAEEDAPEADPEADVPATMPEEDVPATMPEVDDTPAVMPEVDDAPATLPEVETPDVEAPEVDSSANEATIDDLYAIADKLYEGINPEEMPMVGTMELTEENFEYSAFVPYDPSYLAVESLPMMGSTPHSVVIVKADSAEAAAALAQDMKANANPRKWICVSARSVKAVSKGEYAILVMTSVEVMPGEGIDEAKAEEMSAAQSEERADLIISNFLAAL